MTNIKTRNRKLKRLLPASDLIGTKCSDCLKKAEVKDLYHCKVMIYFYFQIGDTDCFAYCDDPGQWLKTLWEIHNHHVGILGKRELILELQAEIREIQALVKKIGSKDIRAVYLGEVHRIKGGGGESQDKTHKLFPAARMADNRYKDPWGAQDKKVKKL